MQRGAITFTKGPFARGDPKWTSVASSLLPRAGLSRDQHRRRGGSHLPDDRKDLLHPPALRDQRALIEGVPVLGLPVEFQLSRIRPIRKAVRTRC